MQIDGGNPQPVTQGAPITETFDLGEHTISYTITDGNGNTDNCSFTITVTDDEIPIPVCINPTFKFNGEESITIKGEDVVDFILSTDNCSEVSFVSADPAVITCDQLGTDVPVVITVQDEVGNMTTCNVLISVIGFPCGFSAPTDGIDCPGASIPDYDPPSETFSLTSDGCYSFNSAQDEMAYVGTELCSDGSFTVEISSRTGLGYSGIVMRENLSSGAKKVGIFARTSYTLLREFRTITNGFTQKAFLTRPGVSWLRLVRSGNTFIGYVSRDGSLWQFIFSINIPMEDCIDVGMAAYSFNNNSVLVTEYNNVLLEPVGPPLVQGTIENGTLEEKSDEINFFPNPTSQELWIDTAPFIGNPVVIALYSKLGKLAYRQEIGSVQADYERIELPQSLTNGLYLLELSSGNDRQTGKIILQR